MQAIKTGQAPKKKSKDSDDSSESDTDGDAGDTSDTDTETEDEDWFPLFMHWLIDCTHSLCDVYVWY